MTMIIDGTNGVTFPDSSQQYNSYYQFKNRIINGAMVIDQRNAGASVSFSSFGYSLDRWNQAKATGSAGTVQQSSVAPAGFTNSILLTNNATGASPSAGDLNRVQTRIEGFNTADLGFGGGSAQTVTLSFWVRSSVTGTYGVSLSNSAFDRSYVATYTVNSANTWEQKIITVSGDTTGTWLTNNGIGIAVSFDLGCGSGFNGTANSWQSGNYLRTSGCVNWVATNSATFYITGVQLEKGSTATSFDYRPYGTELALCQRYYYKLIPGASDPVLANGYVATTSTSRLLTQFPVSMRTRPTALEQNGTAGDYSVYASSGEVVCTSVPTFLFSSVDGAASVFTTGASLTAGQGLFGITNSTTSYLAWSAEL